MLKLCVYNSWYASISSNLQPLPTFIFVIWMLCRGQFFIKSVKTKKTTYAGLTTKVRTKDIWTLCKNFKKFKKKAHFIHTLEQSLMKKSKDLLVFESKELNVTETNGIKSVLRTHMARKLAEHIVSSLWTLATHTVANSMNCRWVYAWC